MKTATLIALALLQLACCSIQAQDFNELSLGDFSEDFNVPTSIGQLFSGANTISGTTGGGDRDILTFNIGDGERVVGFVITEFSGPEGDEGHFFGLAAGTVAPTNSLQYLHADLISSLDGEIPYDLFTFSGANFVTINTDTLEAGDYTLFFNETTSGSVPWSATLVVEAVPEPGSLILLASLSGGMFARRRRN